MSAGKGKLQQSTGKTNQVLHSAHGKGRGNGAEKRSTWKTLRQSGKKEIQNG